MNTLKLLSFLRKNKLMRLADIARFGMQWFQQMQRNRNFRAAYPEVVLPPPYMLYEAFFLDYEKYYQGGRATASWLIEQVRPYLADRTLHVLDWGCGPMRVLRHLPGLLGAAHRYYGTDYNPQTIHWCQTHFPEIQFSQASIAPPLGFPDESFDVIYGISIFTHFSESQHAGWLQELYRISKPGAILLFTTQGQAFMEKMTPTEQLRFAEGRLLVRGNVPEGHRMFSAFHPPSWTRRFFKNLFEIVEHTPGRKQSWGISQDTWILRKTETTTTPA